MNANALVIHDITVSLVVRRKHADLMPTALHLARQVGRGNTNAAWIRRIGWAYISDFHIKQPYQNMAILTSLQYAQRHGFRTNRTIGFEVSWN